MTQDNMAILSILFVVCNPIVTGFLVLGIGIYLHGLAQRLPNKFWYAVIGATIVVCWGVVIFR